MSKSYSCDENGCTDNDASGLVLLPLLPGDLTLAAIVQVLPVNEEVNEEVTAVVIAVVTVVAIVALIVVLIEVLIVVVTAVSVATALLLAAATVLPLLVVENSHPARMIDAREEIGIVTTTTADVLAAQLTVIVETEKTVTAVRTIAKLLPTVTIEKVRPQLQLATMSSCHGTEADTRISPRIPTPCSR